MSNDRSSSGSAHRSRDAERRPEGVLARWSRLKEAARRDARGPAPARAAVPAAPLPAEAPPDGGAAERSPPALPDPQRLGIDADFSAFLRHGVDPLLRRAALRRLWTLDPVFSIQDGLVEYGEDFTDGAKANAVVRTALRVHEVLSRTPDGVGRQATEGGAMVADEPAAAAGPDLAAHERAENLPASGTGPDAGAGARKPGPPAER